MLLIQRISKFTGREVVCHSHRTMHSGTTLSAVNECVSVCVCVCVCVCVLMPPAHKCMSSMMRRSLNKVSSLTSLLITLNTNVDREQAAQATDRAMGGTRQMGMIKVYFRIFVHVSRLMLFVIKIIFRSVWCCAISLDYKYCMVYVIALEPDNRNDFMMERHTIVVYRDYLHVLNQIFLIQTNLAQQLHSTLYNIILSIILYYHILKTFKMY